MILDCDEELKESVKLKELLDSSYTKINNKVGYYLRLKNIIKNNVIGEAIVFRLFKNNKKYNFKGRLHEEIISSIKEIEDESSIGTSDIEILHYGYDKTKEDIDKKSKRNLDILLSYKEYEKDSYYYYVLGNEYGRINKNNEAIINYNKSLMSINKNEYKVYYSYLVVNLVKTLYKEKQYEECISKINEYISVFNDLKDLYFIKFLCNIEILNIKDSIDSLEKYLSINEQDYRYPVTNYGSNSDIEKILLKLKQY